MCLSSGKRIPMSLLSGIGIHVNFPGKELFSGLDLQVEPGDRIGLVGPNGSGKSTILKLLAGEISPDRGEIRISRGTRIGYLPQDVQESLSGALLGALLDSVPGRVPLRKELREIEEALKRVSNRQDQVKLATRLAKLHQELADLDSRFPRHVAERILLGLGFAQEDFKKDIPTLSGGWKMRAALGCILYQDPDLLLLDEPTNHLDLPSVRWLEEFLKGFGGALLLVCHDRDFLNRQVNRVFSLEPEGLRTYRGNYDAYLRAREEERKTLEARAKNQEQKIKEARKFIERFKAKASKARQAQSKIKLVKKIELVQTHRKPRTIRFSFPEVPKSGRDVLALKGISKAFDGKVLYRDLDLRIQRGERVALIGINGAGKTTLLRIIAGETQPDEGRVILGHGVVLSYYAQHHSDMLNDRNTVFEEIHGVVPHQKIGFVRSVCGALLFSGDDVYKSVGVLSGGERARVALAKILVNPGNLLVMDEPTNHLDIVSSEILISALSRFKGTLLFVSHNQSFINRLATKIWDIHRGSVVEYPGNLYEYYDYLAREEAPPSGSEEEPPARAKEAGPLENTRQGKKEIRRERAERRRMINERLNPIQEELARLETRIDEMEKRKGELEKSLADPEVFKEKEKSLPLLKEYTELKNKIEELLGRWEYKHKELETTRKELGLIEEHREATGRD